uniref:Peptidase_M1_N domain-containing protein n=2 Tax=Steinernema glaseri TaxID=37863 RepID=A0A1I7Y812_9BILA
MNEVGGYRCSVGAFSTKSALHRDNAFIQLYTSALSSQIVYKPHASEPNNSPDIERPLGLNKWLVNKLSQSRVVFCSGQLWLPHMSPKVPQRNVQWKEPSRGAQILNFFYCDGHVFWLWFSFSAIASLIYAVIIYFALLNRVPYAPDPDAVPYILVPSHYNLTIRIDTSRDEPKQTFSGRVFIRFRSLLDTAVLFLHLGENVRVDEAALFPEIYNGKRYRVARKRHNPRTEILTIVLNRNITKLTDYSLELSFSGKFRQDTAGPRLFQYRTYNGEERFGALYVHPEKAVQGLRYLIPCLDSLQYPAHFSVNVQRNGVMRALTNSVRLKTVDVKEQANFLEDRFNETIIMFSYQLVIVICDFQYKEETTPETNLMVKGFQ